MERPVAGLPQDFFYAWCIRGGVARVGDRRIRFEVTRSSKTGHGDSVAAEVFAAVEELKENKAPLTEYQAYADRINSLAPGLPTVDRKRLAFELASLGHLALQRPWDHLPDGYVPEGLILVRAPNGSHRVNVVNDGRVARLWLLPIYARSLGAVVAEILWRGAGEWSLQELEALLDASGGPFLVYGLAARDAGATRYRGTRAAGRTFRRRPWEASRLPSSSRQRQRSHRARWTLRVYRAWTRKARSNLLAFRRRRPQDSGDHQQGPHTLRRRKDRGRKHTAPASLVRVKRNEPGTQILEPPD